MQFILKSTSGNAIIMVSIPTLHFSWWAVWTHSLTQHDLKPLSAPYVHSSACAWLLAPQFLHKPAPSWSCTPNFSNPYIYLLFWHLWKFPSGFRSFSLTGFVKNLLLGLALASAHQFICSLKEALSFSLWQLPPQWPDTTDSFGCFWEL